MLHSPELKVERVSYDVITPSAARAVFESIFWKDAIRWEVTKIEVLNPIKWTAIRRNEVGAVAGKNIKSIYIEEKRQQKNALLLKDVRYRIYAKLIFIPVRDRKNMKHDPGSDENPESIMQCLSVGLQKDSVLINPIWVRENLLHLSVL